MKTMKSILWVLALAAAVSCVKEEDPQSENNAIEFGQISFTAVREDVGDVNPSSKSQLDPNDTDDTDGRMVHWMTGDAVIVFEASDESNIVTGSNLPADEGNWYKGYKFATEESGLSADFTIAADDKKAASEEKFNPTAGKYVMLHTYSDTYYCNVEKSVARFYISPDQTATKNSFGKNRGSAIAKVNSLEEEVSFKNLVSLLKFTVPEEFSGKVASITVSGGDKEHIAGDVFVDFSSDEPALQAWHKKYGNTAARYSVALNDADGMEQGDYYIAVLPTTVSEVNVTLTMTDGQTYTRSKVGEYEFKRNTIHYMGAISDAYAAHLTATACETSSSTLAFSWTYGGEAAFDVSRPYTIALYEDEACTELYVSHKVPANSAIWLGNVPKFCFAGLANNTTYYFKVTDTESGVESAVVSSKTDEFTVVTMPSAPAQAGDVILAEDFSEITGQGEYVIRAAAAYNSNDKMNLEPVIGESPEVKLVAFDYETNADFVEDNRSAYLESRLKDWGRSKSELDKASFYAHPGCVKIGTSEAKAYLLTPILSAIPEGKTATLTVTVTVARHSDVSEMNLLCACYDAGTITDLVMEGDIPSSWKNSASLRYSTKNGISDKWTTYTLDIASVKNTWRLMIGPGASAAETAGRMYVSDVKVQIKSLADIQ